MIRVQVRDEEAVESLGGQRGDPVVARGGGGPAHHSRAGVHQIGPPPGHDRHRGAPAVGVGVGCSRAEDDDAGGGCVGGRGGLGGGGGWGRGRGG